MRTTMLILKYEEPGWHEATMHCAEAEEGRPQIQVVERGGVGSMSTAFNEGIPYCLEGDYVWFLTNVRWKKGLLEKLEGVMDANPEAAAVHPSHFSDHSFLRPSSRPVVKRIPFIEWTAPLVRVEALMEVGGLDEEMPYWGFDLDWSYRARTIGWELMVYRPHQVHHCYLNRCAYSEPISKARERLRRKYNESTECRLVRKWGSGWMQELWPTHPRAFTEGFIYTRGGYDVS